MCYQDQTPEVDVQLRDADRIFRSIKVDSGCVAYSELLNMPSLDAYTLCNH